jgi:hypothetical protein
MIEELYFLDEGQVKITAASVGISKQRWTSIKEVEIRSDNYIQIMKSNRFDHLPIIAVSGDVYEYFKTEEINNYDKINRHKIIYEDIIPLDTNIRDVINKFSSTQRTFYFLSFQKRITGLITLGNLNCRQVQVYIFSLICDLERALGDIINTNLTSNEIENYVRGKINSENKEDRYKKMLENYKQLVSLDLENKMTEHFFFIDFFNLITDIKLYEKLGFSKPKWKEQSSINEIRLRVAHPTRSLLDKENDIQKLSIRLDKIEDLLFRLIQAK